MPRRKKPIRAPDPRSNPFLPALLALHDRWEPEHVALVISEIDALGGPDWGLSQAIILRLSRLHQKPPELRYVGPETEMLARAGVTEEPGEIGRCSACGKPAALVVETETGDPVKLCNQCYGMTVGDTARPKVRSDEKGGA